MPLFYHRLVSAIPLALSLLLPTLSTAQQEIPSPLQGGREFWGVFQKNFVDWLVNDLTHEPRRSDPIQLGLAITAEHTATVKVEISGIGFAQQVTVPAGTTAWVEIDTAAQLRSSLVPERLAFHITSDAPVVVTGANRRFQTTDLFQVLPAEALGTRYRTVGYKSLNRNLVSQFAVIATEDNTVVRVNPSAGLVLISPAPAGTPQTETASIANSTIDTVAKVRTTPPARRTAQQSRQHMATRQRRVPTSLEVDSAETINNWGDRTAPARTVEPKEVALLSQPIARPANVPFEITLQRGEVVQMLPTASTHYTRTTTEYDITGTLIEANHPVAVFSGHVCAYVPDGTIKACNTLAEQIPPTSSWGSRFVVAPPQRRSVAVVRVLADHDSTVVSVNGSVAATLGHGEWYEDSAVRTSAIIATSKPALTALYTTGYEHSDETGDPSMTIVPPLHQHTLGYRLLATPLRGSWKNTLMLAVPEEGIPSLRLDNASLTRPEVQKIAGSNYATVQIELTNAAHTVTCDRPFGAMQFGTGYNEAAYDAYGFAYGYPLPNPDTVAVEKIEWEGREGAKETVEAPGSPLSAPPAPIPAEKSTTRPGVER